MDAAMRVVFLFLGFFKLQYGDSQRGKTPQIANFSLSSHFD
jgi:hypothetical protein